MPDQRLIDELIGTYRELNLLVRPIPEAQLTSPATDGASVRDLVLQLRDHELRFSQALKERLSGVTLPEDLEIAGAVLGTEHEDDPTRVLLSQFGTARESTLAMLREMDDAEWDRSLDGSRTIAEHIQRLIDNDRTLLERISASVGRPAGATTPVTGTTPTATTTA